MQLIIAAPENISPEKGTTYKLVRKVFQNTEHVHVVGLRDLRRNSLKRFQEVTKRLPRRVKMKAAAMPPFFRKLRFCTKKWHITARFSLNFFTLGYVKRIGVYILKISLMSNRLARHTFVSIGVVQASRKITAWLFRV